MQIFLIRIRIYREGVATIESSRLSDLQIGSFATRDEQEVAGHAYVPYSSLESVIEKDTAEYDLALRQTQGTIRTDAPDWQPWLMFFLPALALQVVEFAREHGRITMGEAIRLTGGNRNTLKQHFRALVEQGHLVRRGGGRGAWYELR